MSGQRMSREEMRAEIARLDELFLTSGPDELLAERKELLVFRKRAVEQIAVKNRLLISLRKYEAQAPDAIDSNTLDQLRKKLADAEQVVEDLKLQGKKLDQDYQAKEKDFGTGGPDRGGK